MWACYAGFDGLQEAGLPTVVDELLYGLET
jgi:hypothetical protein